MAGIRIPDGRDLDSVFPGNVSGRIFGLSGIRVVGGQDTNDRYQNMRTGQYGPTTGFRGKDGVDLRQYLDTQTGSFLASTYTADSGSVPSPGPGDWGYAAIKAQVDGYMHQYGTWEDNGWAQWFSNPYGNTTGNVGYIYYATPANPSAFAEWQGNINQWLPISSQPRCILQAKPRGTGSWSGTVTIYYSWANAVGNIVQTAHANMTCRGRFKDL